jgi:hypothetical protein
MEVTAIVYRPPSRVRKVRKVRRVRKVFTTSPPHHFFGSRIPDPGPRISTFHILLGYHDGPAQERYC